MVFRKVSRLVAVWCLVQFILAFPASALAGQSETISGTLLVSQADSLALQDIEKQYHLETSYGRIVRLFFNEEPPEYATHGIYAVVSGERLSDPLYADALLVSNLQLFPTAQQMAGVRAVTGTRAALVVKVNFNDASVACTANDLAGSMWDGAQNINGLFQESSFSQISFPRDTDGNGNADVVTVSIAASKDDACDAYTWSSLAETELAGMGVDLNLYQHRIYILPNETTCSWAGLGNLGCSTWCRAWSKYCDTDDVLAHELGHNLGMHHASTDTNNDGVIDCEYCDGSGVMGYGGIGWRHFNAVHKDQMGWVPGANVVTVTEDGTYDLALLELLPASASPVPPTSNQIFKIAVPDTEDTVYYVSYRVNQGSYSSSLGTYNQQVTIHTRVADGARSYLVSRLNLGDTFSDSNGVSVTVSSTDASHCTLLIDVPGGGGSGGGGGGSPTPTPTTDPGPTGSPTPTPEPTPDPDGDSMLSGTFYDTDGNPMSGSMARKIKVIVKDLNFGGKTSFKASGDPAGYSIGLTHGFYNLKISGNITRSYKVVPRGVTLNLSYDSTVDFVLKKKKKRRRSRK